MSHSLSSRATHCSTVLIGKAGFSCRIGGKEWRVKTKIDLLYLCADYPDTIPFPTERKNEPNNFRGEPGQHAMGRMPQGMPSKGSQRLVALLIFRINFRPKMNVKSTKVMKSFV